MATVRRMTEPLAPLPVITTTLLERHERGYLAWVTIANEIVHLPLESAPIDASPHALEIHVEGAAEPLVVLAEPMGPPEPRGFPLLLRPIDETQAATLRAELFGGEPPPPSAKPDKISLTQVTPATAFNPKRHPTLPEPLSEGHTLALGRVTNPSTLTRRAPGSLRGRVLGDGRFVLEDLIGGGASGEVYRARHTALRRAVAVKVLHPSLQQSQDYCARFYAEALAASSLDHRNVLRVLDYGQEPDGLLYIVMELLDGQSLERLLETSGPMPLARIVHLIAQACAGLAHAHDAGVVHRDIKPENIVVLKRRDDDGRETELVKVCDFGIAHWTSHAPTASEEADVHADSATLITRPDPTQVVGTPAYMAPEQIQNDPVDARTDVYALGVVLYELATGRVPFSSQDAMEILSQHIGEAPTRPSEHIEGLAPELERLILKALAKDPAGRHRDARELRAELQRLVDIGVGTSASSGRHHRITMRGTVSAEDFATSTEAALAALQGADERLRAKGYAALAEALRGATIGADVKLARDLLAWLDAKQKDPALAADEREHVERAMFVLRDPEVARAHAIHLLDGKLDRSAETLAMLRAAGPVAARALVEGRRARAPTLEMRSRFVAILGAVGPTSLPVIAAALEPLVALGTRQEEALAEDLLSAMPDARSDTAGDVTVRFVRLDKPSIGVAALKATAMLWGPRARPLLVGVLDAENDPFRLVAIDWLRRLGCVDDLAVERLARIIALPTAASEELKLAAATAFSAAMPEARPRTIAFLHHRLTPAAGFMSSIRQALGTREDTRHVVALARSLVALDPAGARPVLERLAAARPELRALLDGVALGR